MEQLVSYFVQAGFSVIDSNQIAGFFKKSVYEKGECFVKEGKKSLKMGFLQEGQLQYFSVNDQGIEQTTYISLPNSFVASLLPYLTESVARENIRAITNVTLWEIEKKDVLSLQDQVAGFKDFYIKLLEWQICCIDKAKFDLITLTAEQRYEKLLQEEPELLQQIPLQHIASMLGITPRHLSRLRGKI